MGSIGLLKWRKAYMLEFLENGEVSDVFTFALPPESEDFIFSQRVSETKTFGGTVFDDYGNDTYKITLSGSTVNEDKKFIYRGIKKAPLYLTGTKEIFALQEIIKKWADKVGINKKVYLYDLSKMSVLQIAASTSSRNHWRVIIKSLKIKRDKSKPFTYNYTLEMDAMEDTIPEKVGRLADFAETVDKIQGIVNTVQNVMNYVEMASSALNQFMTTITEVKALFETISNRNDFASVALTVGMGLDTVSRIAGGDSKSFYNSTQNVLAAFSTFKGLATGKDKAVIKESAYQSADIFTITFDSQGGSSIPYQRVEYSKTVEKPENPTRDNYTFDGWYTESTCVNEYDFNIEVENAFTLYAKWNLAIATVTYNSRNGSRVPPQYVEVGTTTNRPIVPTRNGYIFDEWCVDYSCTINFDFNTPITQDIILYAKWKQSCNIIFESNGGTEIEAQVVSIGGLAVYPKTPKKENYTFAYWCSDSALQNVFDFSTPILNNTILYACYVQISNTVLFNSLGGSNVDSQEILIGGYATIPEAPIKEGFDFVYWATDIDGTNEFRFAQTPITSNITLYAKWVDSVFVVDFDTGGGSEVESQNVQYGKKTIFPEIPTKENAVFSMWCTRKEIEKEEDDDSEETEYKYEEFDFDTEIKENITLYAKWFGGDN